MKQFDSFVMTIKGFIATQLLLQIGDFAVYRCSRPRPSSLAAIGCYSPPISEDGTSLDCLMSESALALVGVGLVDGLEVGSHHDSAGAHLRDDQADHPMRTDVCVFTVSFPGRAPSLKNSLLCFVASRKSSSSCQKMSFIVLS
jgi:hypothetical protein